VLISIAGWLVCFAIGVALQRRLRDPRRASHLIFMIVLWVLSPLVVISPTPRSCFARSSWRRSHA
jgi:4-amino-4-deoxy-L-arabinose transferase-like glycosyltransferase